jgi:metallo-beta-lactamase family protein
LSAHADQEQLISWASHFEKPRLVILTHGEPEAAETLRDLLRTRLGFNVTGADKNEVFDLESGAED